MPLPLLSEHELDHIHGSGGELGISLIGMPVRGNLSLTYGDRRGSANGSISLDGAGKWQGSFTGMVKAGHGVKLEGSVATDGNGWEVGVAVKIRL